MIEKACLKKNLFPYFCGDFKNFSKGSTSVVPFFFAPMTDTILEQHIDTFLQPLLEGTDIFLTGIKIKPANNIKVYLDADAGLNVEKSARINRKLRAAIEEAQFFPAGDYSLEVSSPGIDEPLTSLRQYRKNIGRTVEVTPLEGTETTGILKEVTDDIVILEIMSEVKGKKKGDVSQVEIPMNFIKKTVVQVTF